MWLADEETGPQAEILILSASLPKTGAPALSWSHPRDVSLSVACVLPFPVWTAICRQAPRWGSKASGIQWGPSHIWGRSSCGSRMGVPRWTRCLSRGTCGHARPSGETGAGDRGKVHHDGHWPFSDSPHVLSAEANYLSRHCREQALGINNCATEDLLNRGVFSGKNSRILMK